MTAVAFDTLKLARALRDRGRLTPEQAEGVADSLSEAFRDEMATKSDIQHLETELKLLEQRMTIKLGGMMALAVGTVAVLVKLL